MNLKFSDAACLTALIAFVQLLGAAAPVSAAPSAQFAACQKSAKTQLALDTCAGAELTMRNKHMQSVYSAILSHDASQPMALAKVKAMQQAWLAYAAAYLEALYPASHKQDG